jgi:hypothetical protein
MGGNLILHDQRVKRVNDPHFKKLIDDHFNRTVIATNGGTSLSIAFGAINDFANKQGKIDYLFIMCHGFESTWKMGEISWLAGGLGLQLGMENLLAINVHLWTLIKNATKNIVVFACGAAGTQPGGAGFPNEDGKILLQDLARFTNATVYGANVTQYYKPTTLETKPWEGTLYCFLSSGNYFPVPPGTIANSLGVF